MSESGRVDVVVAGAINTDLVALVDRAPGAGETVTGKSFAMFGGGKGANQAMAARRSGASVALAGAVGDDAFGAQRREELTAQGINLEGVVQISGMASGAALITVETGGENRIAYVPGPTLHITGEQICKLLESTRPKVYLQPNEVPLASAEAALTVGRSIGAITVLNATPDPETVRAILPLVDYLIVNEGEAIALSGRTGTFEEIIQSLAEQCNASVVLTAGADGVYGFNDGRVIHAAAPRVDVVDTTGAGDTLSGAFAARLAMGEGIDSALRWGVAAASLSATKEGAQSSIPHAQDVEALLNA